jgi:hypothetical protein
MNTVARLDEIGLLVNGVFTTINLKGLSRVEKLVGQSQGTFCPLKVYKDCSHFI